MIYKWVETFGPVMYVTVYYTVAHYRKLCYIVKRFALLLYMIIAFAKVCNFILHVTILYCIVL